MEMNILSRIQFKKYKNLCKEKCTSNQKTFFIILANHKLYSMVDVFFCYSYSTTLTTLEFENEKI